MEIHDIIKTDSDRLFIVDPECYILFTGETTDDIKPFIRIGNWIDMPVELIPLIENIIITDSLIGNPAHEQFNIDVRDLPENRYIGSRGIVRKFLDYQKIFGLDLTNASIVDIEKDLPELSKEKNISHKDQFIGVFYRDGNFKTLLNKNTIFDLNRIIEKPISWQKFHEILSDTNRDTARYDGSGMVVIGHNPMFYDKKYFHSYLFPGEYLRDFSLLGIDPGKIRTIFHPSLNLINISKLFKWLNIAGRNIAVFCNSTDIDLVKKIFSNSVIRNSDFNGLVHKTESGMIVENYPGTYNLKVRYEAVKPRGEELRIAFIKGSGGIHEILKDRPDAMVITYSAYEDIHLLLKSSAAPCAIIDDGNRNLAKLAGNDRIILSPGMQYEFRVFRTLEEMIPLAGLDEETVAAITGDPASLVAELSSANGDGIGPERRRELSNLLSLVRVHLYSTKDRKLSAQLKSIAGNLSFRVGRSGYAHDPSRSAMVLALYNGGLFPFIIDSNFGAGIELFDGIYREPERAYAPGNPGMREYYERIISDRERLALLIDIYTRSEKYNERNMARLHKLKEAIGERKEEYREESLSLENSWSRSIAAAADSAPHAGAGDDRAADLKPGPAAALADKIRSLHMAAKIGIPLAIALVAAGVLLLLFNVKNTEHSAAHESGPVVESRELDVRYRQLGKQLNIRISDHDIYRYANQVALKNGYNKIAPSKIREKNPDWIFPENIFVMLDGQRVTVSRGDTLWNLSKNKLIESTLAFNDIMKRIGAAGSAEKRRLIQEARRHAFSGDQAETLRKTMETIPAAGAEGEAK
jgi:hypothetical protein